MNLFLIAGLIAALTAIQPSYSAHAVSIVVNTDADNSIAGDDLCTLREAITNANSGTDTTSGDCIPGTGIDTITFADNYTITLNGSQLPVIIAFTTITGNDPENTIIQASVCNPVTLPGGCTPAENRIFKVNETGNLTLNNVTVRHSRCTALCEPESASGGIFNLGTLTLINSAVNGNYGNFYGGGITNAGTLTITSSTISGNSATDGYGGGIANLSYTLTIANSILAENEAFAGGGIHNHFGTVHISNSTFTANNVPHGGGGIHNYQGDVTVTDSTFTENSSGVGGGILNEEGDLTAGLSLGVMR